MGILEKNMSQSAKKADIQRQKENTMIIKVKAFTRPSGSQGRFIWRNFDVKIDSNIVPDHFDLVTAWQEQYSHGTESNYEMCAVQQLLEA